MRSEGGGTSFKADTFDFFFGVTSADLCPDGDDAAADGGTTNDLDLALPAVVPNS